MNDISENINYWYSQYCQAVNEQHSLISCAIAAAGGVAVGIMVALRICL